MELTSHLEMSSASAKFGCSHCAGAFSTPDEFTEHVCKRALMKAACECGMVFNTRKDFHTHFYASHRKANFRDGDKCMICLVRYPRGEGTLAHWDSHGKIQRPKTVRRMLQNGIEVAATVTPPTPPTTPPALPLDINSIVAMFTQFVHDKQQARRQIAVEHAAATTAEPPAKRRKFEVASVAALATAHEKVQERLRGNTPLNLSPSEIALHPKFMELWGTFNEEQKTQFLKWRELEMRQNGRNAVPNATVPEVIETKSRESTPMLLNLSPSDIALHPQFMDLWKTFNEEQKKQFLRWREAEIRENGSITPSSSPTIDTPIVYVAVVPLERKEKNSKTRVRKWKRGKESVEIESTMAKEVREKLKRGVPNCGAFFEGAWLRDEDAVKFREWMEYCEREKEMREMEQPRNDRSTRGNESE